MMKRQMLGLVVLGLLASPGLAAMMFTETFDDGTFGSNLVNQDGIHTITAGRVYFAGSDYTTRNYVATNDSDYATTSLDWEYTLEVSNTTVHGRSYVRVGIGTGLPSGDYPAGWFDEPLNGLYISLDTQDTTQPIKVLYSGPGASRPGYPTTLTTLSNMNQTGIARIRKVGGDLIFGWDQGGDGTFVEYSVAIADYPMLSISSKLFCGIFEGNPDTSVDNFIVTPEPATLGILSFGSLLSLFRRKSR